MNRVKEFRKELGIPARARQKDIGVSRQTINMIENDIYNPSGTLSQSRSQPPNWPLNSLFWKEDF